MVNIGVPVPASFTTSGTAVIEDICAESFTWTGAHATFAGNMSVADFKNAFVLSENLDDDNAELLVSMNTDSGAVTAFKAALFAALNGGAKYASGADPAGYSKDAMDAGSSTLQAYLESWAQAEIDADLAENGIPAALEAEHVSNLGLTDFAEDASGGAKTLWDNMAAQQNQAGLNIIARQLPSNRYPEAFSSELPVEKDDVITFRFDISQTYAVSASAADATGEQTAQDGLPAGAPGSGYGVGVRAIDLELTLA